MRRSEVHGVLRCATIVLACVLAAGCSQRGHSGAPAAGSTVGAGTHAAVASAASVGRASGQQKAAVDWSAMQRFWTAAMALKGIDTGPADSQKRMLMFFDPNCPACARQWPIVKPYLDTIRIHWVPVAYIDPNSLQLAAAILSAPDPAKALADNEDHYDFKTARGGYLPPATVPKWAEDAVRANTVSKPFTKPVAATPMWGMELYPGRRYYRSYGVIDARSMSIVVQELGDTMDPYARAAELMKREQPTVPLHSKLQH